MRHFPAKDPRPPAAQTRSTRRLRAAFESRYLPRILQRIRTEKCPGQLFRKSRFAVPVDTKVSPPRRSP